MRRILVCGGRTFAGPVDGKPWDEVRKEEDLMRRVLHSLIIVRYNFDCCIVTGGAPGADRYAEKIAEEFTLPFIRHAANWQKLGRSAGPVRNQIMIDEWMPHLVVAFPGGKGTADMVRRAIKAAIEVKVVDPIAEPSLYELTGGEMG